MIQTTLRAAGLSAPTGDRCNGPDYSHSEHIGITLPVTPKTMTDISCEPYSNVTLDADTISKWWYIHRFPGASRYGVRVMHRRSSFSGNDVEPFVAKMRSSS